MNLEKLNVITLTESGGLTGEIVVIKKRHNHKSRHSYATSVCLANGVSIENVAKMLGHSNIKMTQHYARVLDSSILKDMMNVKSVLSKSL